MKLNILHYILLFLFVVICIFTIKTCYQNHIYSEQQVVLQLSEEVSENAQEYIDFFDYAHNLRNNIKWDTLELKLKEVKYNTNHEIHINFNSFPDTGGFSYDGRRGGILYLSDTNVYIEEDFISKTIKNEIGLSVSQLDSLRNYLAKIEEVDFTLYKDGSVIIQKYIGSGLFDMECYQLVRVGERMFLHENYIDTFYGDIFVGKKN